MSSKTQGVEFLRDSKMDGIKEGQLGVGERLTPPDFTDAYSSNKIVI